MKRSLRERCSSLAPYAPWALLLLFWVSKTFRLWCELGTAHYAMPFDIDAQTPLQYVDSTQMYWFTWWTEMWAWNGKPLLWCDLLNYPLGGESAQVHSLAYVHTLIAGVIQPWVGPSAAVNLVVAAGLAASLVGCFIVVRSVAGNGLFSAVLAILAVSFGLARGNVLFDPELNYLVYFALTLFAWKRYLEQGGWRWALAAVVLAGLTGFIQSYYAVALYAALATAALLSWDGVTFAGVDRSTMLRRTLLVLGAGLAFAALLHVRNILHVLAVNRGEATRLSQPLKWPFTILDGALVLIAVLVPAAIGKIRRIPNAVVWALMFLPVAVITLGFRLNVRGPDLALDMPMEWARQHLPILWRLTFPQRLVAPLLLGMALSCAALWRGLVEAGGPGKLWPGKHGLTAGAAVVAAYWVVGAFVPLTADTSNAGLRSIPGAAPGAAWVHEIGQDIGPAGKRNDGVPPTGEQDVATGPGDEPSSYVFPKVSPRALLWPFQSVRMMPLPAIPECIRRLSRIEGEFAILELASDERSGYQAYFQTVHGKAVAGFPCLSVRLAARNNTLSDLTVLQQKYRDGELDTLPDAASLRQMGVRYVIRYDVPVLDEGMADPREVRPDAPLKRDRSKTAALNFDAAYGPPLCADEITRLYETGSALREPMP